MVFGFWFLGPVVLIKFLKIQKPKLLNVKSLKFKVFKVQ